MFRSSESGLECCMIDFRSSCFLSPASDLAHLILTSCHHDLIKSDWNNILEEYYNIFNTTLCKFGLVLRHLGTNYHHFKQEVDRALAGQFIIVSLVIPILAMFGPQEFVKSTRRRSATFDRENTIRHLIQMMSIVEHESESSDDDDVDLSSELFLEDSSLRNYVCEVLMMGEELNILDIIRQDTRPRSGSWMRTKQTTGKYKPTYRDNRHLPTNIIGSCG